jgi:hypothetical protein
MPPRHNPHPRHRRNGDTRNRDPTLTGPVQTADLRAEVTVSYQWQLRTQIQTMHRHWLLADGTQAPDCIRRRVIFPRELELYLNLAGFELIELSDNHTTSHGELTGPTAYATAQADSPDARVPPWYAACSASARSWQ